MKKKETADVEVTDLHPQTVLNAEVKSKALHRISLCVTAMAIAYILPKLLCIHFAVIEACVKSTLEKSMEVRS